MHCIQQSEESGFCYPFLATTPMQLDTAVCQALGGRPDLAELDISSFAQLLLAAASQLEPV